MALTNLACKNAKCGNKPKKLSDSGGLYLYLSTSGAKLWRFKYRYMGKEKTLSLGQYPKLSLIDARKRREEAKEQLAQNIDPSLLKQQKKQLAMISQENTFEAVARAWIDHMKDSWGPTTAKDRLRRLEYDMFPYIGKTAIKDIKPQLLLATLRKVEARGAHEVARRLLQICGQVFRYAIIHDLVERNVAADLKGALKPQRVNHYAAIESQELPQLLQALERNDARLYHQTRLAIKFLLLTFVRTSELIKAQWPEIDFEHKEWRIPAERMKMRRPHIVPLSRQSIEILEELKKANSRSLWIFPSMTFPRQHMSNNTILLALKRMGYAGRMTGHGFRALAMTTLKERLEYQHDIVDRQLAHAPRSKINAAYDRAQYLPQRRKMMQDWADYLDAAGKAQQAGKWDEPNSTTSISHFPVVYQLTQQYSGTTDSLSKIR